MSELLGGTSSTLSTRRGFLSQAVLPALSMGALAGISGCANRPKVLTGDFTEYLQGTAWEGWEEKHFPTKRVTRYELLQDGKGREVIRASAQGSASMLRKRVDIAPDQLGQIRFSWMAEKMSDDADIAEADATDAVVRVLLAFDGDRGKWSARDSMLGELSRLLMGEEMPYATLVYAWCTKGVRRSVVINPRTPTVRNYLLEAGMQKVGLWRHYRRNIRRDFEHIFGEAPGKLISVGLMTDADNTTSHAVGWYGPLTFEPLDAVTPKT
jgi:hypothetical protein